MLFQSKNAIAKFPRRSVAGPSVREKKKFRRQEQQEWYQTVRGGVAKWFRALDLQYLFVYLQCPQLAQQC